MTNFNALESATELAGDFRIDRVLGAGGFGVTYLAHETALNRLVTIKEYFPADFAARFGGLEAGPRSEASTKDYTWGLERFVEEAQTLAKFDHPNIVRVYRTFNANNTAYMVLQWEEGQSLKSWLKSLGRAPRQKELDRIVAPLLNALEMIHKADFLHRDIAPDNIIIRTNGDPVLIDFGAARGDIAAHSKTKTVSALVKPGYSPYEQYAETSRQQGPWTDIYALAATLYHAIAGQRPPDSPSRMLKDEYVPAAQNALSSYRSTFLDAIDRGLALSIDGRPQSIPAWRGALLAPEPKKPGFLARMREETKRVAPPTKTVRAVAASTELAVASIPPPPDTPAPAGKLLDFVEGLKAPSKAPQAIAPKPEPAQVRSVKLKDPSTPPPAAPTKAEKIAAKKEVPAKVAPALAPPPARARKKAKPAPDIVRNRRWTRGLRSKLAIAASLAAALAVFHNDIPRLLAVQTGTSAIATGSIGKTESQQQGLTPVASFKAHDGSIQGIGLTGDGRLLVTTGTDRVLKIWNRDQRTAAGSIYMDDGPATSLSVRNHRALTSHADGSVNVWDLDKHQRLFRFKRNDASIWSATFIGSEDRLAAAGHDWLATLWQTGSETTPVKLLEGHTNAVQAVASDPAGQWLATGSADRTIRLWRVDTGELKRTYRNISDYVTSLAFASDASLIAAGSLDGSVRIFSPTTGRAIRTFNAHKERVTTVAFSPNGDLLASAAEDGTIRVRGVKTSRPYWTLNGLQNGARALTFDTDSRQLVTGGQDGIVTLWSLPEPALAQR